MLDKINQSKAIIKEARKRFKKIAVASSYGKDSVVLIHLCKTVDPKFTVFNIMTRYKPKETIEIKNWIENYHS